MSNKNLVIYFSHTGENYTSVGIRSLEKGNTEVIAEMIQEFTDSDLFQVEAIHAYPYSYKACTDAALQEKNRNERLELKKYLEDIQAYDTIYIGFPNWWGTMPMPLFSLLEKLDFHGKTIKPFCTHEGSGMGSSEADLKKLCSGGILKKGLLVRGSHVYEAKPLVKTWVLV